MLECADVLECAYFYTT